MTSKVVSMRLCRSVRAEQSSATSDRGVRSRSGFGSIEYSITSALQILDGAGPAEDAGKRAMDLSRRTTDLSPGTMLAREWNGRMQRIAVLAGGFAWNGKTYRSLSKVAFAITGTRWNGPRFFGLRDKSPKEARS